MSKLGVARRLKSLNVTRNKLLSNIKRREREIHDYQAEIKENEKTLADIETQIKSINGSEELNVSEHALLRYLQRVQKIDMEKIAEEICALPSGDMVVRGRTVVTIWPNGEEAQ